MEKVRPVSITHPDHFVNVARRRAAATPNSIFANQFENLANFRAHLKTGEEIWQQSGHSVDAFVCGAGTGGTIAGRRYKSVLQPSSDSPCMLTILFDMLFGSAGSSAHVHAYPARALCMQ